MGKQIVLFIDAYTAEFWIPLFQLTKAGMFRVANTYLLGPRVAHNVSQIDRNKNGHIIGKKVYTNRVDFVENRR